ncbi:hypothetical protein FDP41_001850 [Naegleria fowleri]|uniref:Novel toxin 11 domain-containing protein n=1 Tax=Naegleria fowleri TaxID=5763 RepID=A0A6A5BYX8_NAEFO|nr:uncharacterized protein FDP41_001850 [Naegleria fowleri]KAF0978780.1 hypothetical protein FDP41_001850 [Naegleria fowleri]CAG4716374.1 unnamed protein product [Naegleria fowleri]
MVHFSSSSDHKKSASAALAQDDDYYYNDNYNDSSDDDNDTSGVDMTFSQLYEIMRTQQSVPANILLTLSKKDLVLCELKREGMAPQFKRDAQYWYDTLSVFTYKSRQDFLMSDFTLCNDINEKFKLIDLERKRIDILRRIFVVLRYGDLLFRKSKKTNDWMLWNELKGLPIATAMSHGSRIIVQLPKSANTSQKKGIFKKLFKKDESSHDHGFWTWLLCGDENASLDMVCTPELTNGCEAAKKGFLVFKRTAATHSLGYYTDEIKEDTSVPYSPSSPVTSTSTPTSPSSSSSSSKKKKVKQLRQISVQYTDQNNQRGTMKKLKDIVEIKEKLGLNTRNSKLIGSKEEVMLKHRHWGLNICMGGFGKQLPNFLSHKEAKKARKKGPKKGAKVTYTTVEPTGEHSHIYLYYMSPGPNRYGGIMIGVEGSEPGKKDQSGETHGITAGSPFIGVTDGMKWNKIKDMGMDEYPDKYDSLFIDLSSGWEFLKEKAKEWRDEMVMETIYVKPVKDAEEEAHFKEQQYQEEEADNY